MPSPMRLTMCPPARAAAARRPGPPGAAVAAWRRHRPAATNRRTRRDRVNTIVTSALAGRPETRSTVPADLKCGQTHLSGGRIPVAQQPVGGPARRPWRRRLPLPRADRRSRDRRAAPASARRIRAMTSRVCGWCCATTRRDPRPGREVDRRQLRELLIVERLASHTLRVGNGLRPGPTCVTGQRLTSSNDWSQLRRRRRQPALSTYRQMMSQRRPRSRPSPPRSTGLTDVEVLRRSAHRDARVWIGSLQNSTRRWARASRSNRSCCVNRCSGSRDRSNPIMESSTTGARARDTGEQIKGIPRLHQGRGHRGRRYHALDPETFYWRTPPSSCSSSRSPNTSARWPHRGRETSAVRRARAV